MVVNYVKAQREAEAVAERVRRAGVRVMVARADVGDPMQATRLVEDAVRQMGRLNILVNNAALVILEKAPDLLRVAVVGHVPVVLVQVEEGLAQLPDVDPLAVHVVNGPQHESDAQAWRRRGNHFSGRHL